MTTLMPYDEKLIKAHMRVLIDDDELAYDALTGEVNATLLAEFTADDFGHTEWLDDDLHPIWEAAVEVADECEPDE